MKRLVFVLLAGLALVSCGRDVDTANSNQDQTVGEVKDFSVNTQTVDGFSVAYDVKVTTSMDKLSQNDLITLLRDESANNSAINLYEDRSYLDIVWSTYPQVSHIDVKFDKKFEQGYQAFISTKEKFVATAQTYQVLADQIEAGKKAKNLSKTQLEAMMQELKNTEKSVQELSEEMRKQALPIMGKDNPSDAEAESESDSGNKRGNKQ